MAGFVRSYEGKTHDPQKAHRIMKCFSADKVPVLVRLAQQFCVCHRSLSSLPAPTFPNRAFAPRPTALGRVIMGVDWLNMSKTVYALLVVNSLPSRIHHLHS